MSSPARIRRRHLTLALATVLTASVLLIPDSPATAAQTIGLTDDQ